ncbi:MAG: response regulator [Gammaproteobacteria bacterium]
MANVLADYLSAAGYNTHQLYRGDEVVEWVKAHRPHIILLDLMLPGLDGIEVCKQVRAFTETPIIMTTARVDEVDRLVGLELGADDYICKPYSPREVVARVKAVLRRVAPATPVSAHSTGPITLDERTLRVQILNACVQLTAVEFSLLATLVSQPGRIYSRSQLMDRIYTDHRVVSDRTIDSHVKKLRKKLGEVPGGEELVHSVYAVGYRYEPPAGNH